MKIILDEDLKKQIKEKLNEDWEAFKIDELESLLWNLVDELSRKESKIEELTNQLENDYDPEIEVPEIHGEGISW